MCVCMYVCTYVRMYVCMYACMYVTMYVTEGRSRPSLKQLNNHVVQAVAVKWRDLGIQLLNNTSAKNTLDIIEANHKQVSTLIDYLSMLHVKPYTLSVSIGESISQWFDVKFGPEGWVSELIDYIACSM